MGNNSQLIVDVTMFPVKDQNGAITNVVVEYTDVSQQMRAQKEQRILEGKLRQAQKMEAVGTLAGGIAHDFNNILAAITGYAELALEENLSGNTSPRDIDQILQAAMKAKELVKGILTFSRKTETEFKPLDFNREIRQSISMLKRTIPRMVSITESLSDGLPMVRGDSAQLQQLVLNLGSNANLAMPDGGSLIFETKMVNADDKLCLLHEGLEPGAYVEMTVTDTGMGMDEQTLEHLYEPFYTTREVGSGTGLGLAMAYGIVKRHHGTISCQSRPGQGAAFKVMLPALVNEAVAYEPPEEKDKAAQFGRGETILVVDDELDLRVIAGKALTRTGYQALFAKNGEEALAVYRQNMGLIDLVLLDINMPGMGGARCLEQLKKIDSKLKVLIASGYSPNVTVTSLMEGGAIGYVAKPFVKKELLAAVRKALDSA